MHECKLNSLQLFFLFFICDARSHLSNYGEQKSNSAQTRALIRSIRSMCIRKGNRKFPRWPEIINHNLERDAAANGISQFSAVLLASLHTQNSRLETWKRLEWRDGCGARWRRNWILVSYTHDMSEGSAYNVARNAEEYVNFFTGFLLSQSES